VRKKNEKKGGFREIAFLFSKKDFIDSYLITRRSKTIQNKDLSVFIFGLSKLFKDVYKPTQYL
tara:strand:- start:856 stop:1044 length:189 start_codon:yes stop_codon:yes gene_type:complete